MKVVDAEFAGEVMTDLNQKIAELTARAESDAKAIAALREALRNVTEALDDNDEIAARAYIAVALATHEQETEK